MDLSQSVDVTHDLPMAHPSHSPPPQSTSVSCASFTESAQLTPMHLLFAHIVYWVQSRSVTAQAFPDVHAGHTPPPQSTSVSEPFLILSVQVGAAGTAHASPQTSSPVAASSAGSSVIGVVSSDGPYVVHAGAKAASDAVSRRSGRLQRIGGSPSTG